MAKRQQLDPQGGLEPLSHSRPGAPLAYCMCARSHRAAMPPPDAADWDSFCLDRAASPTLVPGGLESLDVRDSCVIVGTSDGQLLLYAMEPSFVLGARRSLGCGKKPVESVTVVDPAAEGDCVPRSSDCRTIDRRLPLVRAGGVLALCDSMVWVCQIQDGLQISGSLPSSKGSLSLCAHSAPDGGTSLRDAHHVCVGSRRRLQLYCWDGREYVMYQSLELPHTPVSLAWHAEAVVVGFKKASGYAIVRVSASATDAANAGKAAQGATQLSLLPVSTPRACLAIVPPLP